MPDDEDDKVREVDWYELDTGAIVAFVSPGPEGLFMLPVNATEWYWYPKESDGWNSAHQRIFRQYRADRLDGPPGHVPELPAVVPIVAVVDRDDAGTMRENVSLIDWVAAGPSNTRAAFVVLKEDSYETMAGDGLFRDFVGCFPNETDASNCALEPGMRLHLRRIELSVHEGYVRASAERHDFADRYYVEIALADLAKRLK